EGDPAQVNVASTWQELLQPSPAAVFESSQASPASMLPFPHVQFGPESPASQTQALLALQLALAWQSAEVQQALVAIQPAWHPLKPPWHVNPQLPALQVAVPFAGAGQAV